LTRISFQFRSDLRRLIDDFFASAAEILAVDRPRIPAFLEKCPPDIPDL
jgi:hypothetical protein